MDRRRGLPVALSILYVAAARRAGWLAAALDVPGHVLVLVGDEAAPVIVDPFRGGLAVSAEDLAAMLDAQSDPGPAAGPATSPR
ncbi:transglutaminase family protein [Sphingomonas sp. MMS24-JH45]